MSEPTIDSPTGPGMTALYCDFLADGPRLKSYLTADDPVRVSDKVATGGVDRAVMSHILREQNEQFQSKTKCFDAIDRLERDDAVCIFGGQQAGLFGGPLLTLYKAIDIVKRADRLEKDIGRPVVPVFWIACDDHDFEEINHTHYVDRKGGLGRIIYGKGQEPSVPVAEICLKDDSVYEQLKTAAGEAFGGTDFSDELLKRLMGAYAPENCLVKAFARHLADILPDSGLVFFCPHSKEIKSLSGTFFREIIERRPALKDRLEKTATRLIDDGYHIQAEKKESAVHLFYHHPRRTPIHHDDDSFLIGEKRLSRTELLKLIDDYPDRFSPDVLTRPVWQSWLFPVVAQTGGPAEIAYFCQIGGLFELFGLSQPYYYARASATLVEKRTADLMHKLDIEFSDLTGDVEQLINRIAARSFPEDVDERIREFRERFREEFDRFAASMVDFAGNLKPMADQTYGKMEYALKNFEKKIFSEHKRQTTTVRNQIYRLADSLYPEKNLQERVLNINYFISKYGFGLVDYVMKRLDIEDREHQMISLADFTD